MRGKLCAMEPMNASAEVLYETAYHGFRFAKVLFRSFAAVGYFARRSLIVPLSLESSTTSSLGILPRRPFVSYFVILKPGACRVFVMIGRKYSAGIPSSCHIKGGREKNRLSPITSPILTL